MNEVNVKIEGPSAALPASPGPLPIAGMWLLLFAASVTFYLPFLAVPYYADDLLLYFSPPAPRISDYLWMNSETHAYRPAEWMILSSIQSRFHLNTAPIHLISLAAHAALCCIVWIAALRLGFRRWEAVLACGFMFLTQAAPAAVLGNDTMSQAMSTMLATLSCVLLGIACLDYVQKARKHLSVAYWAASVAALFASFCFKETSLGLTGVIALFTLLTAMRTESDWRARLRFIIIRLWPYGLATIIYLALRLNAGGPVSGGGSYRVTIGLNIMKNLGQFLISALVPVSTVSTAVAVQTRSLGILAIAAAGVVVMMAILAAGIWFSRRKRLVLLLACCVFAALFPAFVVLHVSELYVYNAIPWIALLFTTAVGALWDRRSTVARLAVIAGAVMFFSGSMHASWQKAGMMYANGRSAAAMRDVIANYLKNVAEGGELVLTEAPVRKVRYSIFLMPGLDVMLFGTRNIGNMCGRPDIRVRFMEEPEARGLSSDPQRLVLEFRNGVLQPLGTQSR